jgi:hypothetical protein
MLVVWFDVGGRVGVVWCLQYLPGARPANSRTRRPCRGGDWVMVGLLSID